MGEVPPGQRRAEANQLTRRINAEFGELVKPLKGGKCTIEIEWGDGDSWKAEHDSPKKAQRWAIKSLKAQMSQGITIKSVSVEGSDYAITWTIAS